MKNCEPIGLEFWESDDGRPKNATLLSDYVIKDLETLYASDIERIQGACFLSKDEIKHNQWQRLTKIVTDAYENVPFYRNLYQGIGFEPGDLTNWDAYYQLPIINKNQMLDAGLESRINTRFNRGDLFLTRSSGSTGKVLRIAVDKDAILVDTLQGINQIYLQGGKRYHADHLLAYIYTVPWWFDNVGGEYQNAFISSLIEPQRIVSILNQLNPHIITCYPSHLAAILDVSKTLSNNLHLVIVHSEMSSKAQREDFSKQLGVPVLDEYSSEELTRIALEMPCGHYHVREDAVLLEVLHDSDWTPVADGECGIAVGTNLLNVAMPFIRYCQGDHIKLPAHQEPCDINWLQIETVEGRTNDSFISDKGQVIPAGTLLDASYRWMFDSGIQPYAFEMVQKSKNEIEISLCCTDGLVDGQLETLRSTIYQHIGTLVGEQCDISVNITTQDFPRGKKYRPIRRDF